MQKPYSIAKQYKSILPIAPPAKDAQPATFSPTSKPTGPAITAPAKAPINGYVATLKRDA